MLRISESPSLEIFLLQLTTHSSSRVLPSTPFVCTVSMRHQVIVLNRISPLSRKVNLSISWLTIFFIFFGLAMLKARFMKLFRNHLRVQGGVDWEMSSFSTLYQCFRRKRLGISLGHVRDWMNVNVFWNWIEALYVTPFRSLDSLLSLDFEFVLTILFST